MEVTSLPTLPVKLLSPSTDPFLLRRIDLDLANSFPSAVSAMIHECECVWSDSNATRGAEAEESRDTKPPKMFPPKSDLET